MKKAVFNVNYDFRLSFRWYILIKRLDGIKFTWFLKIESDTKMKAFRIVLDAIFFNAFKMPWYFEKKALRWRRIYYWMLFASFHILKQTDGIYLSWYLKIETASSRQDTPVMAGPLSFLCAVGLRTTPFTFFFKTYLLLR